MPFKKGFFIGLGVILVGLPIAVFAAFLLAYQQRIYPNTWINDINVSGLSKKQAEKILSEKEIAGKLILSFENRSWETETEKLGLNYNYPKSAEKAYNLSRKRPVKNWFLVKTSSLEFSLDLSVLEENLATISAQIYQPDIPAEISFDEEKREIVINQGEFGQELNLDQSKEAILQKISFYQISEPIELVVNKLNHLPSEKEIAFTKERAEKLIGKTITLTSNQQNFILEDNQLINFLGFSSQWDEEKIKEYANILSQSLEKMPKDALFEFSNGRVVSFQSDQPGFKLSSEETVKLIIQALNQAIGNGENNIIELPLAEIEPEVNNSDTNRLGINSLLSIGESNFRGSISSRIHNLDLASSRLNGLLIAPGETFSLNNAVGDISKATGYKDAYIIQDGRTVMGEGGGVCQVSTTMFRAAINAGLPIVERHQHAYRVHYYENDSKVGFDAAIFSPTADLKFKNDTQAHILIQRTYNPKTYYLAFSLYGSPDNRKTEISNVRLWDVVPPPEDQYVDDPTLPIGQVKQIDFKAWGSKAAFDWKVTREGEILYQQTFFSNYRPWQAIYLKGTKPI